MRIKWALRGKSLIIFNGLRTFRLFVKTKYHLEIINAKDAVLIASWIDKRRTLCHFSDLPFKFKFIYRASREGFEINNFHNNCDNKGPTVVIKVRNSEADIIHYNDLCINSLRSFNNIIGKSRKYSYEKKIISRETFETEEHEYYFTFPVFLPYWCFHYKEYSNALAFAGVTSLSLVVFILGG
ncbi:hypothetical protein Glove_58g81 [Diversispora epigaea]|uniref:TLDc domain-containing protein n=1 Tax=Diversispora epigaea TaxID=1348612 RepID=A0A397JM08_9GLOM|nr:hypothetical protein Glove_58g81 [Diversispora epigaea]